MQLQSQIYNPPSCKHDTYIPTYLPTYTPTYLHEYMHDDMHTCINSLAVSAGFLHPLHSSSDSLIFRHGQFLRCAPFTHVPHQISNWIALTAEASVVSFVLRVVQLPFCIL